jgi:2-polyprenyl-3-methyl-5-hydroxy-6-metoxy-1,4-benzoquinol methylase
LPPDNLRDFYEIAGQRFNIWEANAASNVRFGEILRYRRLLGLIPHNCSSLLDLGCGDGYLSYLVAKRGLPVFALDLSLKHLVNFSQVAEEFRITRILADLHNLPLGDGHFDCVLLSQVIEHLPDRKTVLTEARRVLRPGGKLIVSVPYKEELAVVVCPYCLKSFNPSAHVHSFDKEGLERELLDTGFAIKKSVLSNSLLIGGIRRLLNLPPGLLAFFDAPATKLFPSLAHYIITVASKD